MKNYFIIHALGNTANNHWYQVVKKAIEKNGAKCYVPTLPPIESMSYASWSKEFDKYKVIIENAGHFTKGYEKEFKEILEYL